MHRPSALKVITEPNKPSISSNQRTLADLRVAAETGCSDDYAARDHTNPDGTNGSPQTEPETEFSDSEPESGVYFTRDQRRSRRKRQVRAQTINMSRFAQSALEVGRLLQPEIDIPRPRTRIECLDVPRPCPFVSCRHHLYLDVLPKTGSIKLNFPDLEVDELDQSCSLDVAEQGALTAEDLGEVMNLTRERIRQIERRGLQNAFAQLDSSESSE